jgi:hypothetical protein
VGPNGREVEKSFETQAAAEAWVTRQTADIVNGSYVAPRDAATTFDDWSAQWLRAYATHRESTVRQARVHLKVISEQFGHTALADIKPSMVKMWTAKLQEDYKPSTVYALYRRLSHVLDDAVHDGYLARNPCSRRTAPPMGKATSIALRQNRFGSCTTGCPNVFAWRSCSAHSPDCASPKRLRSELSKTWTLCAELCFPNSSGLAQGQPI